MSAEANTLPRELQSSVDRWLERFGESAHRASLARLVTCSEFAGKVMLREKDWLLQNIATFDEPPNTRGLENCVGTDNIQAQLRRFRNRYLLHVLWREVFGLANLDETLASLTALADRMLDVAARHAEQSLQPRYGVVRNAVGAKVPLVILGMGKLGGQELNFSSDIDIIFLYPDDGTTDGAKQASAQEYFGRLSRSIIALLDERTADGFVFRIDTRLRPFGDSGPPVASFDALESYLLQHGRDWERYAYIKARVVGPRPGDDIVTELHRDLIRPFVYRRYVDFGVFESLREMHSMIAAEVRKRELQDNVKLGPGGIREAEFVVQSLQLVRGGSEPGLQSHELQKILPLLIGPRGLSAEGANELGDGYRYMRRLENFIQAIRDEQTHDLPTGESDQARLCEAMGCADWGELRTEFERHRAGIAAQFEQVALRERSDETPFQKRIRQAWELGADEETWAALLRAAEFSDADEVAAILARFARNSGTRPIDSAARERLQRFVPRLVLEVQQSDRPMLALSRTVSIVERVLRRSAYLALLNENQGALARLVDLCARSHYVAEQIERYPALLDELLDPRLYSTVVTRADLAAELRQRLAGEDEDAEARMQAIAQFQRAIMFRIAVADFTGKLPIMKVSDGLTWLAEVVLGEALRVAWHDLVERHGVPRCTDGGVGREAGFGVIAYGKLGGLELSYGSDLDIVFLHDSRGVNQVTDGDRPLDNTLFFGRLVRRLVHFLTTQTSSGQLYEIDTRLRPDGHKGLLVSNVDAFERYQEDNAWTWEHQALLRARPVAGSAAVAKEFKRIRRETLVGRVRHDTLREDVISMRQRMRDELDRSGTDAYDLKHGRGGIGDIEFLVQYLVLNQAEKHPGVIDYSDNIRQLDALVAEACLDESVGDALQATYRLYRLRQHHLVLDKHPPLVDPDEFVEEREFVAKTWDDWLA